MYNFNAILAILFFTVTLCYTLYLIAFLMATHRYVVDGGDMRICILAEALLFYAVFFIKLVELINPSKVGVFSIIGAITFRLYLFYSVYFMVNCKTIGLRLTMKSTILKNYIYIFTSVFFLSLLTMFIISFEADVFNPILRGFPHSDAIGKLISVFDIFESNTLLQDTLIGNITEILLWIFIGAGIALCIVLDFIEKRQIPIKIMTFSMIVPFGIEVTSRLHTIYTYNNLKLLAIILYIMIPLLILTFENINIIYHTTYNPGKLYKKTILRARKENGNWSIITERQAKILAEALSSDINETLSSSLSWKPKTKDRVFAEYVNSLMRTLD